MTLSNVSSRADRTALGQTTERKGIVMPLSHRKGHQTGREEGNAVRNTQPLKNTICPQFSWRLHFFCWKAYVMSCLKFTQSTCLLHKCLMPRATRQWFSIQTRPMENIAVLLPPTQEVHLTQHSSPCLSLAHSQSQTFMIWFLDDLLLTREKK